MGLFDWDVGFVITLNFILAASQIYVTGGGNLLDSVWFWGPGLVVEIPVYLMKVAASQFALLAPIALVAVLLYLRELKAFVGEGVYLLMLIGAILYGLA